MEFLMAMVLTMGHKLRRVKIEMLDDIVAYTRLDRVSVLR